MLSNPHVLLFCSNCYGRELDYTMYGYRTLNQMCLSLSRIFHHIRPDKGDFKLFDRRKPIPENVSTNSEPQIEQTNTTVAVSMPNLKVKCNFHSLKLM